MFPLKQMRKRQTDRQKNPIELMPINESNLHQKTDLCQN